MDRLFTNLCLIFESSFALFLGGLGLFLLFFALRLKPDDEACGTWPKSQGVVIGNELKTELNQRGRINYIPVVQYIFQANHRMVQGNRICVGRPLHFMRLQKANQVLENYPLGCKVWVFYNPQDPEEAVLERRIYDRQQCLILGVVFILLMIILLSVTVYLWRSDHQLDLRLIF
jgi:hypothetical protein